LTEGPKVLFRLALYILIQNEDHIISGGMEEMFAIIKMCINNLDDDDMMKIHKIGKLLIFLEFILMNAL
jgi:hypothetical protein